MLKFSLVREHGRIMWSPVSFCDTNICTFGVGNTVLVSWSDSAAPSFIAKSAKIEFANLRIRAGMVLGWRQRTCSSVQKLHLPRKNALRDGSLIALPFFYL